MEAFFCSQRALSVASTSHRLGAGVAERWEGAGLGGGGGRGYRRLPFLFRRRPLIGVVVVFDSRTVSIPFFFAFWNEIVD